MAGNADATAPAVTLHEMTDAEYDRWREHSVESFAADVARTTGRPLEATRIRARAQFEGWMPAGRATAGMWLLTIRDERGEAVGTMWFGPHPDRPTAAFLYDIEIVEDRRGSGLGRAAMVEMERLVAAAGFGEIGLNVFGFNTGAQRLYASLGYRVLSTQMAKRLS